MLVSGTIYNRKKISWDFSSSNWHFGSRKQKASVPLCELLSISVQTSVLVQLLSCVWLFATPWTAAPQASLPITYSQSLLKLMSIELVVPSNHLILCRPLCLLPSMFPSIKVFSNEYSGLSSFKTDWFDLLAVQGTLKSLLQHHSSKH